MSNTWRARTVRRLTGGVLLALCIGLAIERAGAQQQGSVGANVNVISGTGADGDWTLQRQNEPSIACSSRNPLNCLAGANDYRTVDIPFPTVGEKVTGDAWLGWYTTKNGGLTWRTRLLPGYPQDTSAVGLASPLRGYAAGADPVIRPGTNGLFYYGGLVFNREEGGGSAIFVARFIDNNNQEGAAGEPIDYLGASIVHRIGAVPTVVARRQGREGRPARATAARRPTTPANTRAARVRAGVEQPGTATQMVDKPWIAVDVPRAGAQTCSIGGPGTGTPLQTFPGGRVYMAYALFDGPDEQRGRIMFSSSANCGVTWSAPRVLSRVQSGDVNDDGVVNTADLSRVQASYNRTCGQTGFNPNADTNNDCRVDLLDLSFVGRAVGQPVPRQPRLSQGATIAIDPRNDPDGGAVQIAWRQFDDGVLGDAIVTVRSINGGASFSPPNVVATLSPFEQGTTNTSFRTNAFPTMAMDGTGRAYLAWSARGEALARPSPVDGDGRVVLSTSDTGVTWSAPAPIDNQGNPGHQIMPALTFAQGKLQLIYYDLREDVSQLFGPFVDELPILAGPPPRRRHTVDVWGAQADPGANPTFAPFRISQYRSGGAPGSQIVEPLEYNPPNLPIFRAGTSPFMGDYLDVATEAPFVRNGSGWSFNTAVTASPVFHGIWTDNRDIRPPANGRWTDYTPPNPPFARPTMSGFDPTQAIPACVPGQAGMRNQNVYTARITRGLVVGAVGNSRRLGAIQRSFPVFAQNNGTTVKSYRLTIANQPVGGQASFKQFEPLTTLDVEVPRRSTVARTVFARSTDPFAQITVSVTEIAAPGGAPVTGGQQGTIVLNPDPSNPDLENPDLENPDLENPDLENSEVHNPDLENATTRNPDLENPDLENPDLENPDLENTRVANPSIINPDLENPDLENPDLENPDLENPDLENPDLENGALSDTTWTVTNKGNTASAYTVRLALNRQLPEGFRGQLIAHKIYQTPAALGCSLLKQSQTVLIANIPTARFVTPGDLANPDLENPDLENLTLAIAPGETVRITLRVYDPVKADAITFRAAESVTPVAVAQAVNTPEADAGITQPAAAGVLTSSAPVPGGTSGGDYTTALTSTLPGTWTVAGGTVPPGLTVDPATGGITGTPTTPGTYTFTARFQSTIGIIDYRTVTITVGAVGADANVGVAATGPGAPVAIGTPFAYTLNVSNAGPAAASNVRLTDTLPEGTQFVSATTTAGTCQHANGTLLCNLGTLGSGAAATIVLNVRPTTGGSHTNTAVVTATEADPVATNNSAVSTASTSVTVTPCTTVCFSGPTSYIAGPADPEFGAEKGDFNGDGFVDLIFAPAGVNTLGIMLANGAGGFGPPSSIPIPGTPNGAAVADYNNDGHQDVVISSERTAEAWVLIGNGLGQFGAPVIVPLPTTPQNVVAADFNRDGNVDLALAGDTGPLVMILHGNGNGTFQPTTTIGTTTTFSTVVTDDVNNDTNPDLVVHQAEVGLVIILGNGAAGFQPPTTIPITEISGVIKTGDLTGDGFADLILGSVPPTGAELHLYVGDGLGGFTPSVMIGDPTLTDGAPAVGDLDSDGDLDVVWGRSGGGVAIQLNNGSGTFAAAIYLASPQVGQILVADYNGDGRPDLALPIGDAPQSQFLVFLNTCDQPPAELAVTLTGPTDPVAEGSPFTYNIEVTNNGPNPATGVQLDFAFDPSAAFVASGGSPASCSVMGNRVTCQIGTLAIGAVSALAIDVLPRSGGTLQATAGVTGTTSDPDPANNTAFASTTVTPGASTLVVTNTNRSGPGSLYQAIVDANDPGPRDTIRFNIDGPGPHTIAPTGDLPDITQPVVIDGTTQPGYAGTPLIEINGQNAGTAFGLVVNGSNSIVRGLAINRFHHVGIVLSGAGGHRLEANFIGTNTSGTAALGNLEQGVFISSPNNVIGGATAAERNVISGNTAQGVIIAGPAATGNVVSGNFIGSNATGTARIPNGFAGVAVTNGASNNSIGGTTAGAGNLISGNTGPGVNISGAGTTGNTVAGNLIGTNAAGSAALFNGNSGVVLNSGTTSNAVGGTTAAARNVISGNNQSGVNISGTGTTANTVAGNYIGTNATGTAAIANGTAGVLVQSSGNTIGGTATSGGNLVSGNTSGGVNLSGTGANGNQVLGNRIGTNAAGTAAVANGNNGINIFGGASNNTVGGSSVATRNVVSGNLGSGIRIQDAAGTGNVVRGNYVGTDAAGAASVANGNNGIEFGFATVGNTVGGPQAADGNLISGNTNTGLAFFTVGTGGNQALSNLIGTDATGTQPLGNGSHGVYMQSNNNRVGSLTTTIGNVIAFNGAYGVRVETGTGNAIVNNSIFSNGLMGIDLVPGGLTPNDAGDIDTGSNTLINFPVLSSARTVGANVLVQVALSPAPVGQYQVHFYVSAACDPTGYGEGQTLIGVTSGTGAGADANFEAGFSAALVPAGSFITATMTDANGNTSEFSPCATVASDAGTANLSITQQDSPDPVTVGSPLTYTIAVSNLGPDAAANVTVTETLPANVTLVSANASIGSCSGTTTVTCVLGTVASGANVSVGIVVTPTAVGVLTTPVTVTAASIDPDTANNSVTTTTTVVAQGPLTLVVSNTNDSGAGSFRQAIDDANARQGPDTITFNIPGAAAGVRTISGSPLPTITDQVTIDGTTQPGFSGTPLIELSGADAAAGSNGLVVNAQDSVIRGLIVNRWTGSGIVLQGPAATSIVGSWIGTASDGTTAAGNGNGILIQTSGHLIGGTTAGERNVISGNTIGVNIGSTSARGNVVIGNYIGTDRTGTLDLGNTEAGVLILGEANVIGGPAAGNRNVISGNDEAGVRLTGGATANSVLGNIIGVNASGTGALGNGIGVQVGVNVDGTASTNFIGGVIAGEGNEIAFSTTTGVMVGQSSTDNAIVGNSIHQNGTLGIDLIGNGVTPNDLGDTDEGANNLTNFPVLSAAAGGVQGTLNSFPDSTFRIEFFGNLACDASGNGEGQLFLGSTAVTTDATGNATIPLFAAATGQFVTATATDSSNNTSEFSACVTPLGMAAEIAVSVGDSPDPVVVGGQLSYTVTVTNNGSGPATNVRLSALWNGPFNVDATSPSGTCEFTPLLFCTFGTLQSGANATLGIVGTPGAIGLLGGSFTIQADEDDPVPANNAVAVNTSVVGGPFSFLVTNTNDTGAGSLRQAILNANASAGADLISFAIPGAGPFTITPASALPTITNPVVIDGTTQPGFTGTPIVELSGASAGGGNGLTISAGGSTVRGLVINRFGAAGIDLNSGSGNVVEGNYLGTNVAGTSALGNNQGISIFSPSTNNTIGGTTAAARNLISGNGNRGISISDSGNFVIGNYIGTNAAGTGALGNGATGNSAGVGIDGSNNTVTGNLISGNFGLGINILSTTATGNTIRGNLIGTNAAGTLALANTAAGINVNGPSNIIGGTTAADRNVVSGNTGLGINILSSATGTTVLGNFIGTNSAGSAAVPNSNGGVQLGTSNNVVGGLTAAARNVISGNGVPGSGVYAFGVGVFGTITGNQIQGNFIGLNASGTAAIANTGIGVQIGTAASATLVGGTTAGAGNVISGNGFGNPVTGNDTGLGMFQTTGNTVQGNFIGTNEAGTTSIPNRGGGITIIESSGNTVGGSVVEARNVISGNQRYGVGVFINSPGNVIAGNWIGSSATGSPLGNQNDGVVIDSSNNTVGGTAAAGNRIVSNGTNGVTINNGTGNDIRANAIANNGGLGIDLQSNGVTANDTGDADTGANELQNFPVLTTAAGGVEGTLNSLPNTTFRVEFFDNTACDASGNGEGATFLGATAVTTDAAGNATIPLFTAAAGQFVTSTATDSSNNTSEFSACVLTAEAGVITLTATDADAAELGGNTGTVIVTRSGATTLDRDVAISLDGTSFHQIDYTISSPTLVTSAPGGFTVRILAGQTTATVTLTPIFSPLVEGPETAVFSAEGSTATVTIADEPAVTLTATDPDASELGPNTATISVSRTVAAGYDRDVAVSLDGTSFHQIDYTISSPTLVTSAPGGFTVRIPASQTTATVTLTPIVSAEVEGPETAIFSAEGSSATVTIVDQFAPPTLTVTTTADSGAGSLRAAILAANASTGTLDTIVFNIPGAGPHTIGLATFLPTITDPVVIDATTQPGYSGTPRVAIDGIQTGTTSNGLFIGNTGSGSTIRGLAIHRFGTGGNLNDLGGAGIVIQGAGGNTIERNFLGTDADGLAALPNRADGIFVDNSPNNVIGGPNSAQGNLISGNGRFGIMLSGEGTSNTRVQSNRIGLDAINSGTLGNTSAGIAIFGSNLNVIGGASGAGNLIAFNEGPGVRVASGGGNVISANYIAFNGGLGIDLGAAGVTANDAGDADAGANNLQNYPVLTPATGGVTVAFNGQPNATFTVEFFGNTACDASGHGEGETQFGSFLMTTDANGNFTPALFPVAAGWFVSATVTDGDNNTSEFSACALSGEAPSMALTPTSGQQGATLNVSITGSNTHFVNGTTTVDFGAGITVNSLTVSGPTSASANITIGVTAFAGGRTVTVTSGAEAVSNTFSVTAGPAALSSLTPNTAQQGQSNLDIAVTAQSTHFANGVTTASFGGDITVNTVTVTSPTTATVNITLNEFAAPGLRTVTLTTSGESASLLNGFNVVAGSPRILQVTPESAQQGQTLTLTVTGQFTSFVNGTTTASLGAGITVNSVTVTSATSASVNVTIAALATIGTRTVTLTTGGQGASSLGSGSFFGVTRSPAAIASVSPSSGRQAENLTVTVTGSATHFASGSTAFSFSGGITVTSAQINSPTSATLDISVAPGAALGALTVTATTLGEVAELANAFTVTPGLPAISTVTPPTARQAERLNVTVTSFFTHFADGATVANFGPGITINAVDAIDATHAVVDVTVSPGAALGARTVVMTTGSELAELVGGFTVTPGQPTLFSVSPNSAMQGTSLTVVLGGAFTNFTPQLTTVFFGSGISVGTVTVNGPTLASVPITIAPGATVGARTVTVTTGSEVVGLINGFTVTQGTPTVASIDPNAGQHGVTLNVTITGVFTNWQTGATTVSYGAGVTVNSNVVNSATSITTNISIDAGAALGLRDVIVTTGTQSLTVPGGFAVTDVDTTVPTLLRLSPGSGSTGIPLNTVSTFEFSEPLLRSTVTEATVQLYDQTLGTFIDADVSLDATGRVATLVPSRLLAVNRGHTVYLSQLITDVAGNHLGFQGYSFTTGFSTDTTGPTLRQANPQGGDTGIARNVRLVLQFDRSINLATLAIGVRLQTGGVTVPGTYVQEDGQRRLRFTPASPLAADTTYTLALTSELKDVAGNALTNPGTIAFTTGPDSDTVAPTVTAGTPYYNQIDVGLRPVIRVAFNERINPISLLSSAFYLYNYYTGAVVRTTITVAPDRLSATLVPDAPLAPHSYYYYYVAPFSDLAGNNGSLGATYFRTSGVEDTEPPAIVAIAPANGATGVPVNARIRVLVSEPIDAASVTSSTVQLTPAVAGSIAVDTDRLGFLFTPAASLAVSTNYTMQIGPLRDTSGNLLAAVVTSFMTSASATPDTTAPTVVSFSPATGATGVSVNSPIVMTVSEPVRVRDLETSMRVFAIIPAFGSIQLSGTYGLNAAGTVITFTPQVPYPGNTPITVYSNYDGTTTDLAGNALQSTSATFSTAAVADTAPPTIVMVTPPDGAIGIGPAAVVTLTFSEPLHPATVNNDTFTLFAGATQLNPSISRSADNTTVFLTATLPFDALITVVATGDVTDASGNPLADFSSTFATGSTIETNRPQIVTQRPTGPGIPADSDITLFVNKPLDASTVAAAIFVAQNGVLVEGAVTVSGGGTAIHFDPATTLTPSATIQIYVTDDATDLFGNALFAYSGSFTVAPNAAAQGPTLIRTSPVSSSSGNPTNAVIDIEFSEPLLASTVTSANVYVRDAANLPVAGTLSLRNGDRTIRFTPAQPFAVNNYNYTYLTNGLRDLQNTPYVGTNFYFYAGTSADGTAPTIQSISPWNGAAGVGINATVRVHFSEPISPLSVTATTMSLTSSAGTIPASVTYDTTNRVATLVPRVPLPASTAITVAVNGLEDVAGNDVAPQTVVFTTGAGADTVRATVIATNITAYGVTNVPTNAQFEITFDEPMDVGTVLAHAQSFLYDYGLGRYLTGTASMTADGLSMTFVPDATLAVNRQYGIFMSIPVDLAGNTMNALSLVFRTTLVSDTTPPAVLGVNPVAGSTNVARNGRVEIRFSEAISALTIGNVRLLTNGSPVAVTRVLSETNQLLTLSPNGLLGSNRTYTVSVAGVRDTTGNLMAGTFTSTFTTGSRTDLVAPTITGTTPLYNDTGVGLNVVVRLTFSEPVDPLSISGSVFRIVNAETGAIIDATVSLAADRRSVTLTPASPLQPYRAYYYQLISFADVAGNAGGGVSSYFYTGASLDTSAPTVVATSPASGTPGLPVNTRVIVVMSEPIDPTSVSNASIQLTPAAPGTVTLATDRLTLTFVATANLATSTGYSVLVTGLRDSAANTMAAANITFTTGASATPDTTAPTIVSRTPTSGSAGVPVNATLTFTTSERITASAVGPGSSPVYAAVSGVGTFQLAGTYTVDSTGTLVTFNVTGAFPANATIQWYTNNNSTIRDLAGLLLPNQVASFTTANTPDVTGPVVQAVTPTNGSAGVGPYATVSLTFSESVNPNTVNPTSVTLFAGSTRIAGNLTRSLDNRMVFLSTTLPPQSTITVVATSEIKDLSGNALATFTSSFVTAPALITGHPQVITQRPTGSGVAPTTPITLFLNYPVNPATVQGAVFVSQNGVLVGGSVTVDAGNHALVFTPSVPFAALASIEIFLTSDARGADGVDVVAYQGSFTIANDPATGPPTLQRTTPVMSSGANATTTIIDLEFSEPLNPSTVNAASVFVRDATTALVPGTLSLRAGNRVVRFTPSAPLAVNNYNYVYYTNQLLDLQGAAVVGSNFYFFTNGTADSTNPAVTAIVPSNATTGVGVNSAIRVTFSEAINPTSVRPETVTVSVGGSPIGTTMALASGNLSAIITPQRPLPVGTSVTVTVIGVDDPSGRLAPSTSVSFTTGTAPDITAPTTVASILSGDTGVPVNSIFEWTFSEPIDSTTFLSQTNIFYDYTTAQYISGGTLSLSADLRHGTFVPPAAMGAGRQHWLGLGSVVDLSGNVGGGVAVIFTTSALTDTTAPQVVVVTPGNGLSDVPLNAKVRIAFDEAISPVSLSGANVLVSGLPIPIESRTLSDGNRVLILELAGLMAPNTVHTLSLQGIKDRAGNTMASQVAATFTTGTGVDIVNLATTVVVSPASGATNVPVGTAPSVTFSDAIDATTVIYGGINGISLQVAATSANVPVTFSFAADRRTVTMTPLAPLAAGTQYRIRASTSVTDQAGNIFPANVAFLFTTQP